MFQLSLLCVRFFYSFLSGSIEVFPNKQWLRAGLSVPISNKCKKHVEEVGFAEPFKHQKGRKQDGLVLVILWLILEWFE